MRGVVLGWVLLISACGAQDAPPVGESAIFPDMELPGPFNRMYSYTESADKMHRVWTQERGDLTLLFEMRQDADGNWSEITEITGWPTQGFVGEASFSPFDGYLYYSSNALLESRGRGNDPNLWRVLPTETGWGEPEPLSDALNTGASELSPVMDEAGRLYYTSNHSDGAGGHDIYEARWNEALNDWTVLKMPDGINSRRADAQIGVTPDGQHLFFYTYRQPKLGYVDIWMTSRDENGIWGDPVNIGPPVNTEKPELGAGVSLDGQTFFFSRDGQLLQIPLEEAMANAGWTGETPE
ncbi:MAG: hypothetical protein QNI84_06700 [Henriciella sp.]|nr:hypothetical protein [Henriciella sp.]